MLRAELLRARGEAGVIEAGTRDAWRALEAELRPFVARRVPGAADVDDVVQDVFLRMQRGLGKLRDEERFGPWVYKVARSAIAEHHRGRARHPLAAGDPPEEVSPGADQAPGEDENGIACDLAGQLAPLVAMLPSPYREAITLTELEGLSQREAAEMLGVSLSGMKSRVQRGRERLRALLEACCDIALDARGKVIECQPAARPRPPGECCD